MTDVKVGGKRVRLKDADVIGVGGEATVFNHQGAALKLYHKPDAARDAKLRAMLPKTQPLPQRVIAPKELVFDKSGTQAVGYIMLLLDATYTDVRQLSVKKYRAQTGIGAREVSGLFLDIYHTLEAIHQGGMVVGDFNDLNLLFKGQEAAFIDTDSFQFDQYPCMVGTEVFLDPQLYGKDLSSGVYFQPANDWYSFAVMCFKSLLLTHPYGGVHPQVNLLTQRAQQQITVLDAQVTYPKVAYSPDLLSDDLLHHFDQWFAKGWRGVFAVNLLQEYLAKLVTCNHCGASYPAQRPHCPICSTVAPVMMLDPKQVQSHILIDADGDIFAWQVEGQTVRALTHENGKAVLYVAEAGRPARRLALFQAARTESYAFLGNYLVISPSKASDTLMIVDTSGDSAVGVLQTTTQHFAGQFPVFGVSRQYLYRIAGGYLMRGQVQNGQLVEQSLMAISEGQTWFAVAEPQEVVLGYFRVFEDYRFWLYQDRQQFDANVTPLAPDEFLVDIAVKFSDKTVLVIRQTQLNGTEGIRLDELDFKGQRLQALQVTHADFMPIQGYAYMQNTLLLTTDKGIMQFRLDTQAQKIFKQTGARVKHGDSLAIYQSGVAVLQERLVMAIVL